MCVEKVVNNDRKLKCENGEMKFVKDGVSCAPKNCPAFTDLTSLNFNVDVISSFATLKAQSGCDQDGNWEATSDQNELVTHSVACGSHPAAV